MGVVAQGDDVAVVALDVAAVEELVEGGGELVCVAGGVVGGSRGCESVFDVVPCVHCFFVFLSVVSCLFSFASMWLRVFYRAFSCSSWYHGCNGGVKSPQTGKKKRKTMRERHSRARLKRGFHVVACCDCGF